MKKLHLSCQQKREALSWENSMRILLISLAGITVQAYADVPLGIIGGETSDAGAYGAFISSSGEVTPITGLPGTGEIDSVSINSRGFCLIGGLDGSDGYAAFVSPTGVVTPLSIAAPSGSIQSAAINLSGNGILGGSDYSGTYTALVASDGTITPFASSDNFIDSVSLNDAGLGLIGGEGTSHPYAAYVTPDGTVTPVPDIPTASFGRLYVALNDLGNGIVGGGHSNAAFAAFVTPDEESSILLSPLPGEYGYLKAVAINHSGIGLIGGADESSDAYAGYAATDGTVTPLFDSPFSGVINGVAMNSTGSGIIGGQNGSDLYAAFVQPNGTVTSLISDPIPGEINSVAINEAGVGLIGGQQGSSEGYAALVAPNGTLTLLDMSDQSSILSVALTPGNSITNAATPQSAGSFLSVAYTQLAVTSALESRFIQLNNIWTQARGSETAQLNISSSALLACNDEDLALSHNPVSTEKSKQLNQNSIWISPFGDFIHLKAQGTIPSYTNEVGGVLIGYDWQTSNYMVGAALGYAFNYIDYSQGLGHGKLQQEIASFYGSYYRDHFRFSGALWGGLYQLSNTRHTLSLITSTSKPHGWILAPYIEVASPWAIDQKQFYFVEPFFALDWINSWQSHFTESGSAGFNLEMGSIYGSLLQSEVGLRFYEQFAYGWGDFNLEEKLSYVNQAPFYPSSATTSFVGAASTFPIAVASTKVENLAAIQLTGAFVPRNSSYPTGGFSAQATANSSYQSYFVSLFSSWTF